MTPYLVPLEIVPADIDELGHVNNIVYLRWVQDAATLHWRAIAPPDMQTRWVWVVLRHEIDYKASAKLGDTVAARTWVGAPKGARFDRFVEIFNPTTGSVNASARTTWVLLDAAARRPTRVPAEVVEMFKPFSGDG
jgi:acyl-CoA thioester hydrolase